MCKYMLNFLQGSSLIYSGLILTYLLNADIRNSGIFDMVC